MAQKHDLLMYRQSRKRERRVGTITAAESKGGTSCDKEVTKLY